MEFGVKMMSKKRCHSLNSTFLFFLFIISGDLFQTVVGSSSNDVGASTSKLKNAGLYCSQETCQELRERVESLEKTVKAIISSLSYDKNRNFATISKNMMENQVEEHVYLPTLPDWIDINDNDMEENYQTTAKTLSNSPPKPAGIYLESDFPCINCSNKYKVMK